MWIFIILVIAGFAALLIYGSYFPAEGQTSGTVEEVKVEIEEVHEHPQRHAHMNVDPRSYRVYVRYMWKGHEYRGKSFAAYSTAKYFPGDHVTILVHKTQKGIVKIVK